MAVAGVVVFVFLPVAERFVRCSFLSVVFFSFKGTIGTCQCRQLSLRALLLKPPPSMRSRGPFPLTGSIGMLKLFSKRLQIHFAVVNLLAFASFYSGELVVGAFVFFGVVVV